MRNEEALGKSHCSDTVEMLAVAVLEGAGYFRVEANSRLSSAGKKDCLVRNRLVGLVGDGTNLRLVLSIG